MNSGSPDKESREQFSSPTIPPQSPAGTYAVFVGPNGLRPGWRIGLYVALFFLFFGIFQLMLGGLSRVGILALGRLTPGWLLAQEVGQAVSAVGAALAMGRMEGRHFGDYGMPWSGALRACSFWQGALWGIGEITVLIGLSMRALGGYSFGGWALGRREAFSRSRAVVCGALPDGGIVRGVFLSRLRAVHRDARDWVSGLPPFCFRQRSLERCHI